MNHYEASEISLYADGELDAAGAAALREHLDECAACSAVYDDFLAVRERVVTAPSSSDPFERRRALAHVLAAGKATPHRRTVAVPVPVLSGLVVALCLSVGALLFDRPAPAPPAAVQPPVTPAPAPGAIDPARFDGGGRMEIFVERRGPRGEG